MDSEHIKSIRENNLGIMLISLIEDYERKLRAAYERAGFDDVRRSHGYVLRYLEQYGSRVTDIALRAGITKQTAGKIVQELERTGYVHVTTVAGDHRVRLVQFSLRGQELVNESQVLVQELHDNYAQQVGGGVFEQFEAALGVFVGALARNIPQLSGEGWRSANPFFHFGRYMVEIAADFEGRLRKKLVDKGFPAIKRSYLSLLFHLDFEGSRLSALAQRIAVTPQAASLTISELVRIGYICQSNDPRDQRARLICLTDLGHRLIEAIAVTVEEINQDYAQLVGESAVSSLRECLSTILQKLRISVFV